MALPAFRLKKSSSTSSITNGFRRLQSRPRNVLWSLSLNWEITISRSKLRYRLSSICIGHHHGLGFQPLDHTSKWPNLMDPEILPQLLTWIEYQIARSIIHDLASAGREPEK